MPRLPILILSTLAVVCVGAAIYLRIRRHMKRAKGTVSDMEHDPQAGKSAG